jgi:bifunctional DNA-binding transcriptional regulator/antitoxin component of YhaV-PrlF toxin-antitoxin module
VGNLSLRGTRSYEAISGCGHRLLRCARNDTLLVDPIGRVLSRSPKEIREALKLIPGQKVQALLYENRIALIPVQPAKQMRGFLKGIDTTVVREGDRLIKTGTPGTAYGLIPAYVYRLCQLHQLGSRHNENCCIEGRCL